MHRFSPKIGVILLLAVFTASGCRSNQAHFQIVAKSDAKIHSFAIHRDRIWLGTTEGLISLPKEGGKASYLQENAGLKGRQANIQGVLPDGDRLILATSAGVAEFSIRDGRVVRTWTARDGLGNDSIREVYIFEGELWAATIFGASRYNSRSNRWKTYSESDGLPRKHIYKLAFNEGRIWASSIGSGLAVFVSADGRWKAVPQQKGLGNTHIYDMEPIPGGLWLGTAGGVNFFSTHAGRWDERVCADGFTEYCVYAIKLVENTLWFGTSFGLYARDLASGSQKLYTCNDGLPGNEVVSIDLNDRTLWVCTREGIAKLKEKPGT